LFIITNFSIFKSTTNITREEQTKGSLKTKTIKDKNKLRFLDPEVNWGVDFNLENYLNHKTEQSLESILIEELKKPVKFINTKKSSKNTNALSSLTHQKHYKEILNNAVKNENKFSEFRNIEVTQIL